MFDSKRQDEIKRLYRETEQNQKMASHRRFFSYVYHLFTNAPLYTQWQDLLSYVRKFRAIAFLLRVLTVILTIIETGALVILTTAVFLVILPILISLMLGILLTALIDSGRANRELKSALGEKKTYIFFLPRGDAAFLCANAKSLACDGNGVIVVSPYWISPKGFSGRHFYFTVRREGKGLYLIRRYYFFSFRKRVLKKENAVIVY